MSTRRVPHQRLKKMAIPHHLEKKRWQFHTEKNGKTTKCGIPTFFSLQKSRCGIAIFFFCIRYVDDCVDMLMIMLCVDVLMC
jgi:hypothetical protein